MRVCVNKKHKPALVAPPQAGEDGNVTQFPLSVGQRLKQARERAGLSRQQVADKLFLHQGYVKALEEDCYEKLPGPTFIKGYIRAYCKFLGLSSDVLINIYMDVAVSSSIEEEACVEEFKRYSRTKSRSYLGHKVAVFGLTLVVAALIGWPYVLSWLGALSQGSESVPTVGSVDPLSTQIQERLLGDGDGGVSDDLIKPVVTLINQGRTLLIGTSAVDTEAQIELYFLESTYVQVLDNSGSVSHRQSHPAGATVSLGGRPPFSVTLSDYSSVTLKYNGQQIDLTHY